MSSILDEYPEEDKWVRTGFSVGDWHSANYVDWLEDKVCDLEAERNRLRKELNAANKKLFLNKKKDYNKHIHEQDYLPYDERYDR